MGSCSEENKEKAGKMETLTCVFGVESMFNKLCVIFPFTILFIFLQNSPRCGKKG